jgi:sister chromatid cohesion protein DCC1
MTSSYFTLVEEKPKLSKIKNLLEMNLFSGRAYDANSDAKKYTIYDLLDVIQSSEEEIYKYLNFIEAFQIEGNWRLLDFNYLIDLIENILRLIEEKCLPLDRIPINEIINDLKDLYSL